MRTRGRFGTLLLMLTAGTLHAQDITGTWQGTLNAGPQQLRSILIVAKTDSGGLPARS